ncbi:uncharacterized protein FIBRA_02989 [Fibroporia radiculosa]|uniref:Uncharacterized protein n=1 Tax=Fibroporia radiculosa TaxID=599839 RepID=J4HVQ9_9APHY|nr:uncharacterized protein FIBRA_02989 [Fibroporia radiculosa]CCM00942.1 predicted protein [Fibroporia radiculosa]
MAQSSSPPQLSKHPIPLSANANGGTNVFPFVPRKEFIRDPRVISSFSLLALSGANLVRLYSFPPLVTSALRRLFDQQDLLVSFRELSQKQFFEFCLDRRPWASPKSIESEKLVVGILSAVLQCGYSFMSSVDYGREPDDRIALVFSKPVSVSSSSGPITTGSAATLHPSRAPFAISFVSPSILRVVDPPLPSTPAILQAVRGSWPRGVVSEKKLGDATYQFKLKGYKFFQEDTFAADSLQQILSLLTTLDSHAFTFLTSLTLTNRSRKQDLWIFIGPLEDTPVFDSPHSSPAPSSQELRGDSLPYTAQAPNEKLVPIGSSYRAGGAMPAASSPLKPISSAQKVQNNILRKASQQVPIPLAMIPDSDSAANSPVENKQHPFSSSMGSVDMTGIGSGRGKGGERLSRSPDVLYMTAGVPGYAHTYAYRAPWQAVGYMMPPSHPILPSMHASFGTDVRTLDHTLSDTETAAPALPSSIPPPETSATQPLPSVISTSPSAPPSTNGQLPTSKEQGTPMPSSGSVGNGYFQSSHSSGNLQRSGSKGKDLSLKLDIPDFPRTPTPPLLSPGIFEGDSAFSSATAQTSLEVPFTYPGHESELGRSFLAEIKEEDEGGRQREVKDTSRERPPRAHIQRSTGPFYLGASQGAPTPKDERRYNDVSNMLPPTIIERPSQEQDLRGRLVNKTNNRREGSESDSRGRSSTPQSSSVDKSGSRSTGTGSPVVKRPAAARSDTDSSGWVLVNIEKGERSAQDSGKGKSRQAQSASPDPFRRTKLAGKNPNPYPPPSQRPAPHTRSSSDSKLPRSQQSKESRGAKSSMSPAAKAIVIIDAVGAKKEQEKSNSHSGFRRIFSKNKDKERLKLGR